MAWLLISILTVLCLLAITIQDFKFRSVHWWLFPLLFIFGILYSLQYQALVVVLYNIMYSTLYLFFTGIIIKFYFMLKEKRANRIVGAKIGLGDLLFFIALTPFFELFSYIVFVLLSSFFALLIHFLFRRSHFYGDKLYIPLAGIQSILLLVFTCVGFFNVRIYAFMMSYVN